jgi:hypothetical protein
LSSSRKSWFPTNCNSSSSSPNGRQREITFYRKKKNPVPYTLTIKNLGDNVYRLEVNESLPNGEYSISPPDSNQAFCFAVY